LCVPKDYLAEFARNQQRGCVWSAGSRQCPVEKGWFLIDVHLNLTAIRDMDGSAIEGHANLSRYYRATEISGETPAKRAPVSAVGFFQLIGMLPAMKAVA